MDIPDISLVIQWQATCKLAALWQHFCQAAQNKQLTGTAILFAEKEHFDDERAAKAARRVRQAATHKWTAKDASLPGTLQPLKYAALSLPDGDSMDNCPQSQYSVDMVVDIDLNGYLDEESGDEALSLILADASGMSQNGVGQVLLEALARGEKLLSQLVHAGKWQRRYLDIGTDFLINAEKQMGMMCQRMVSDVCFNNAAAETDHQECNSDNMQGCSCCHIMEPPIHCDIHNPLNFVSYDSPNPKAPQVTQHSHLPKYMKDKNNYDLEQAFLTWCKEKTVATYRWACLYDNGPVVMMNSTLDHIINCMHHHKIQTPQDLKKETIWADSDLYANEVISLIQRHASPTHITFYFYTTEKRHPHSAWHHQSHPHYVNASLKQ
ncbi:hypothetical protein EV401DRAFT_1854340 [Pisolithus croceorrhizus]|nr:hypothetical protein EV401DRAFT_1854340 [Pisolithus croceorrhizus]